MLVKEDIECHIEFLQHIYCFTNALKVCDADLRSKKWMVLWRNIDTIKDICV